MTAHDAHHAADRRLPHPHGAVVAAGCALRRSIGAAGHDGAKRQRLHGCGVLAEGAQQFSIGGRPDLERTVHARGHERLAVGAEGEGLHGGGMGGEGEGPREARAAVFDAVKHCAVVGTRGGERLAVGAESEARHHIGVAGGRAEPAVLPPVEQAHPAPLAGRAGADCEQRAAWLKRQRRGAFIVAGKLLQFPARGGSA